MRSFYGLMTVAKRLRRFSSLSTVPTPKNSLCGCINTLVNGEKVALDLCSEDLIANKKLFRKDGFSQRFSDQNLRITIVS